MDPIALALTGAKMVGGAIQFLSGRRQQKKLKRPGYDIPDEFESNVGLARGIKTMGGMPSEQYERGTQEIGRSLSAGMGMLRGRRAATAGVSSLVQRALDAQGNLDVASANMNRQSIMMGTQMEMGAQAQLGSQKLAKQNWEKFQPYMEKLRESQALMGAGLQNAFGGASDIAQMSMYDKYFNK